LHILAQLLLMVNGKKEEKAIVIILILIPAKLGKKQKITKLQGWRGNMKLGNISSLFSSVTSIFRPKLFIGIMATLIISLAFTGYQLRIQMINSAEANASVSQLKDSLAANNSAIFELKRHNIKKQELAIKRESANTKSNKKLNKKQTELQYVQIIKEVKGGECLDQPVPSAVLNVLR